jgi:hypothetical protein
MGHLLLLRWFTQAAYGLIGMADDRKQVGQT